MACNESNNSNAPDTKRIDVNVAASIEVCFNAMRHSNELPANAIIVMKMKKAVRREEIRRHMTDDRNRRENRIKIITKDDEDVHIY